VNALDRAIHHLGTANELARRLGLFPQHVNNWKTRGVPAARCIDIELATDGVVTRYDLRPDVFGQASEAGG
jgi:DNA-binding transcriptional regulator YdaS (Cro superfamily)